MNINKLRMLLYSNPITAYFLKFRLRCIESFIEWRSSIWPIVKIRIFHPHTVFLVLTPEHGNLGDHAIAVAEKSFLKQVGQQYYELTHGNLLYFRDKKRLNIINGATIMVNGGGNLGTLWFNVEELFRDLILANYKSKIIQMPNTIFYEDSVWGKTELAKSIKIYNAHPNLHLFAREAVSYSVMKDIYNNVEAVPDMVLSLHFPDNGSVRKGCLLCFRNDCEKTISSKEESAIRNVAEKYYSNSIDRTDMVEDRWITIDKRESAVMNKIKQFQRAELVITDRLHAMIFCAISETPCIVVNSMSPKVKGTYDKLKHLPYIRFASSIVELEQLISEVTSVKERKYDNSAILPEYDKIRKLLIER